MSILALSALAGLSAASLASAHMQLASPFPYNSPLNSATPEADKDYSMTSPLVASGIYPCKVRPLPVALSLRSPPCWVRDKGLR